MYWNRLRFTPLKYVSSRLRYPLTEKKDIAKHLKDIGNRLHKARKRLGFNFTSISESLGLTVKALSEMEEGVKSPNQSYLLLLAREYHVNINWILTGKGRMFVSEIEQNYDFGNDKRQMNEIIYMMEQSPYVRFKIIAHYWEIKSENKDIFDSVIEKVPLIS